jgi:hypothetical protein
VRAKIVGRVFKAENDVGEVTILVWHYDALDDSTKGENGDGEPIAAGQSPSRNGLLSREVGDD